MSPRAVLFDLDGVLADSFELWLHAMNEVALQLGHPAITRRQLEEAFGQGVEKDLRVFYPGSQRADLEAAYAEAVPRNLHRMTANPEAGTVLESLGAQGIGRAVVTNTQEQAVPAVLEACGLAEHLDVVVGVGPGVSEKPDPDLLLAACAALGVEPADALMVGDTGYDARAAAAAGVPYLHYELRSGASLATALRDR